MNHRTLGALAFLATLGGCLHDPEAPQAGGDAAAAPAPPPYETQTLNYSRMLYLAANPGSLTRESESPPPFVLEEGDLNLVVTMTWTPVADTARELLLAVSADEKEEERLEGPSPLVYRSPAPVAGTWEAEVGVPFGAAFANQRVDFQVTWERAP